MTNYPKMNGVRFCVLLALAATGAVVSCNADKSSETPAQSAVITTPDR
ncbi:hypothetical protein ACAW74_18745 [Fibrella sp. WM1]